MIAIATLLTAVLISLLVTRVATIWLTATGMSREAARFQARSAFTGVGFTTRESEQLVNHPVRRRVVMFLMLLGNAGVVAVLGSTVLGLAGERPTSHTLLRIFVALAGLAVVWAVSKSTWVDQRLAKLVRALLRRRYGMDVVDHAPLLHIAGDWLVAELFVREGDWLAGQTVGALRLRDEGVTVLGVVKGDAEYVAWPSADSALDPGDTVIVYGRSSRVAELDQRAAGPRGERAHRHAAAQHRSSASDQDGAAPDAG